MAYELTAQNFERTILDTDGLALVDFWASWCGPCQMQSPVIEELSEELDDVIIGKVNVDEQPQLAMQFEVMSIPTLLLFRNGECISEQVGYHSKRDLLALIQQYK